MFSKHGLVLAATGVSIAATQLAWAQQAPEIEQIVVTGKFIDSGAKSAMKTDAQVRDTPFSVSSYSDAFMKAIETTNIADMYKYMTGVARTGGSGNDLNMRGFSMTAEDKNAIMVNGLPGLAGRFGSPPTIAVDHIEVVKGPASVLYGTAQPGGFVNIVSKQPSATQAASVDVKGIFDRNGGKGYSASIDLSGPIDADKKFLYRLVVERLDRDLFRTNTYDKTIYAAPSLTWNLSRNTSATVQLEHREAKDFYDLYLVAPNNNIGLVAPHTTVYEQPGDYRNEFSNAMSIAVKHKFESGVKWNLSARAVKHHDDAAGFDQVGYITTGVARDDTNCTTAIPCLRMRARGQHNEREWDFYDTNFIVPFNTGEVGHKLLMGLNGGREIADFQRLQFSRGLASCPTSTSFNCLTQNIYNPVYTFPALQSLPIGNLSRQATTTYSTGVYGSDMMKLSQQWKATVGLRYATDTQNIVDRMNVGVPTQSKRSDKTTPMAGILYQPTGEWTIYTSYATSYQPAPASAIDVDGKNPFKPETAKQFEVGTKLERDDGKLNGTLALFQIDKQDVLSSFSCALGTCAKQVGGAQSRGVEMELNLRPIEGWQITAGYAYTDARFVAADDPALIGARLVNVPRNSAHIWSRYDFGGDMAGWGIGAGANATSRRSGTLPSSTDTSVLQLPGYAIVDAGVYYQAGRYALTLKISNLLDKQFIESAGFEAGNLSVLPGTPRNVQLSMRMGF